MELPTAFHESAIFPEDCGVAERVMPIITGVGAGVGYLISKSKSLPQAKIAARRQNRDADRTVCLIF